MAKKDEHRIIITHATELKPGAKYLIAFEEGSIPAEDVPKLNTALKAMGIDNAVAIITDGDPTNVMKVIEQEA